MAHHDDVILTHDKVSFRASGGPRVNLDILWTGSGQRKTNRRWSQKYRTYDLADAADTEAKLYELLNMFEALEGPEDTFLVQDPNDWNTTASQKLDGSPVPAFDDQPLQNTVTGGTTGDGSTTTFQCRKDYTIGAAAAHQRLLYKPKSPILVGVNGVLQTVTVDYTVNYATGIVTFTAAPGGGLDVTWGGEFYVKVAFEDMQWLTEIIDGTGGNVRGARSIPLVEVP